MAGDGATPAGPAAATAAGARPGALKVQIYAAAANAAFADKVAQALDAEGFAIVTGAFESSRAAAVVVVWSGAAIASKRLIEAALAPLQHGALVAVSIGRIEPPDAFKGRAPTDLSNWSGAASDPRWRAVVDEIRRASRRDDAAADEGAPAGPEAGAGDPDFLSWFEPPYTDDERPKARAAPVALPPLAPPRRARAVSPALLAGFGVLAAALFAGFSLIGVRTPAQAPRLDAPADRAAPAAAATHEIAVLATAQPAAVSPAAGPPAREAAAQAAPDAAPPAVDEIAALIEMHAAADADAAPAIEADAGDAAASAPPAASPFLRDCAACPELAVIPAGAFVMGAAGATPRRSAEGPPLAVEIARPFALARRETSVAEWGACVAAKACAPAPDTGWNGDDLPVTNVSWTDAEAFAGWLSRATGKAYRLPSEAEWEYAARAGATSSFSFGDALAAKDASFDGALPFGGAAGAALKRPRPVASYAANAFGLYDMHGNVWEWTADCWAPSHRGAPADGSPRDGACQSRVIKGGAWNSGGWRLRAEHRIGKNAAAREFDNGFRVARDLP